MQRRVHPDQPMPTFPIDLPFPFILSCNGITHDRFFLKNYSPEYSDRKGWTSEEKKVRSTGICPSDGDLLPDAEKASKEMVCFPSVISLLQLDTRSRLC